MAIAGNSPRKSRATHKDKETHDATKRDTDDENEDDLEQSTKINSQTSASVMTKGIGDSYLNMTEEEIVSAEESLQNFLISTVGKSNSKVYDVISKNGRKLQINSKSSILKKDETGSGIFILLAGKVNVLTSDENEVVKILSSGDVFGEVSTLFNIPVTANIKASASDVTLIKLSKDVTMDLFRDFVQDLDIIDWFIQRRYLPTGSSVDSGRMYRRLALNTLKRIHLFSYWTDEMLKKLILLFDHNILTLYPEKSFIVLEKDPLTSLYVVVSGDIEIRQDSEVINKKYVTSENDVFVFTELAVLVDGKVSPVTIQAMTNCHVIQLNKDWVIKILEGFPEHMITFSEEARLVRTSFKRFGNTYLKNEAYLHIEMLSSYLKQSPLYVELTEQQLWRKILDGDLQELENGSSVIQDADHEEYESLVIVRGEAIRSSKRDFHDSDAIPYAVGDDKSGLNDNENSPDIANFVLTAAGNKANHNIDNDKHDMIVGSVIDMTAITENSVSLKANTSCLILKLRKSPNVDISVVSTETVLPEKALSENALSMV